MFGLIPMVITIILAAIVAGAFAYFGGDIYSDSSVSAKANGFINEGSQIRSAGQLHRVKEAAWPANVAELVTDDYLGGNPGGTYTIDSDGHVEATTTDNADLTVAVCAKVQEAAIGDGDPANIATAEPTGQLFGCYGTDDTGSPVAPYTFFHM